MVIFRENLLHTDRIRLVATGFVVDYPDSRIRPVTLIPVNAVNAAIEIDRQRFIAAPFDCQHIGCFPFSMQIDKRGVAFLPFENLFHYSAYNYPDQPCVSRQFRCVVVAEIVVTPVDSHGYLPVDFSHILLHLIEVGSGDSGTPGPPFEAFAVVQRMRELVVQASNDTNVSADRTAIGLELQALSSEIDRIASQTEFNTMKLLSGGFSNKVLQVGANATQTIKFSISAMSSAKLGVTVAAIADNVKGKTVGSAISPLISTVNKALSLVSQQRSKLGALQNRLDHTIANADNMAENLQSSESKIRDVDMAKEMVTYSAKSILQQAGQSMLAQANQATQGVLSLLR